VLESKSRSGAESVCEHVEDLNAIPQYADREAEFRPNLCRAIKAVQKTFK
jgi:hypothetical protein